jgi:hypothetical protein
MPMLSLIIGVLVMDALGMGVEIKTIDSFFFQLCFGLSSAYLLVIVLPVLLQPYISQSPIRLLEDSNLWLAPLQGLVMALMGAFFVKKEQA